MTPEDGESPAGREAGDAPRKREYVAPKLEKLGTIRDLTRGLGDKKNFDGSHPPGQNKSRL